MQEDRFILTIVGKDHPGIIAGITNTLYEYKCNIQELNQTILSDEFAMILLLQTPKEIDVHELNNSLKKSCEKLKVTYTLRTATAGSGSVSRLARDKTIITVFGSDKIGIISGVSSVLADMSINILELSAAPYMIDDTPQYAMIALVEIGKDTDIFALKNRLDSCAQQLSVRIDIQNQDIFNATHKI